VKAIHIEVANSMDTDSFINALWRFICRRGLPKKIRSDNGSNFVGAEKKLKNAIRQWNQTKIDEFQHRAFPNVQPDTKCAVEKTYVQLKFPECAVEILYI
jgi:hypothetical protein